MIEIAMFIVAGWMILVLFSLIGIVLRLGWILSELESQAPLPPASQPAPVKQQRVRQTMWDEPE